MAPTLPHAEPQPRRRRALERVPPPEAGSGPRLALRIERCACQLLDADNFAGGCKALIDCLRLARLIPQDDPATIEITFAQTRVPSKKLEGVRLTVSTL